MGIKIMNKKGLEFKLAFFAIIGLSMIIVAATLMLTTWNTQYDSNINPDLDEFNKLNDISAVAEDQQSRISPQSSDPGSDFEARSFRGAFGIINSVFSSFSVLLGSGGMINAVAVRFGMPSFIAQGIVSMMVIAIVMAIVAVIFRLTRRTA